MADEQLLLTILNGICCNEQKKYLKQQMIYQSNPMSIFMKTCKIFYAFCNHSNKISRSHERHDFFVQNENKTKQMVI